MRYVQKQPLDVFFKRIGALKNFLDFSGKHFCWSLFLIKLQLFKPVYLLKRDSNTSVFLWTLQNFEGHLLWRTYANDCFCISEIQITNNVIYTLAENFIFSFRIYKIFSYLRSFTNFSFTEFMCVCVFFLT